MGRRVGSGLGGAVGVGHSGDIIDFGVGVGHLRARQHTTTDKILRRGSVNRRSLRARHCTAGSSRERSQQPTYLGEQSHLFAATGDLHALKRAGEPDVDIEVAGVLMKVEEGSGSAREVTPLALSQLGERAQLRQQFF